MIRHTPGTICLSSEYCSMVLLTCVVNTDMTKEESIMRKEQLLRLMGKSKLVLFGVGLLCILVLSIGSYLSACGDCPNTGTEEIGVVYSGFYANCKSSGGFGFTYGTQPVVEVTHNGEKHCLQHYEYRQSHKNCTSGAENLKCEDDGTYVVRYYDGGGCKAFGCKSLTPHAPSNKTDKVANSC